jgi:FAD/FMN-containing dehydrogenase
VSICPQGGALAQLGGLVATRSAGQLSTRSGGIKELAPEGALGTNPSFVVAAQPGRSAAQVERVYVGASYRVAEAVGAALDPAGRMNPGTLLQRSE